VNGRDVVEHRFSGGGVDDHDADAVGDGVVQLARKTSALVEDREPRPRVALALQPFYDRLQGVDDERDPDALEALGGIALREDADEEGGRHHPWLAQVIGREHGAVGAWAGGLRAASWDRREAARRAHWRISEGCPARREGRMTVSRGATVPRGRLSVPGWAEGPRAAPPLAASACVLSGSTRESDP
jgi:hypothetical protein